MLRSLLRSALPIYLALAANSAVNTNTAHAHFKLLKPAADVTQDGLGYPQKNAPCGPGSKYLNLSNGQPTGAITTYKAGETISVEWEETIPHPGYWRFALAEDRADFMEPAITKLQDTSCNFDEKTDVPKTASGNVLVDGAMFRSREGFKGESGKMFSFKLTLPKEPCEKCTLQVIQVMENDAQGLSNCLYHHCADIRIVAANAADAGSGTVVYTDGGVGPDTGHYNDDEDVGGDGDGDAQSSGDGDAHSHGGDGDGDSNGDGDDDQEGSNGGPTTPAKSDSSCSVDFAGKGPTGGLLVFGLLGLAAVARRSRRRRS